MVCNPREIIDTTIAHLIRGLYALEVCPLTAYPSARVSLPHTSPIPM